MKQITFNNVKAKNIVTGEEREIPAITGRNYDREISDINDRIDDLELFKFPNVTIIGTPTINHGQISGFSNSSYLKFPFLVDFRNHSFEIKMAFTTGTNVTSQENIFDSDFGLAFAIRDSRFVIAVSTNGTNWDLGEGVGRYSVQPNTTYYVRLGWDLTNYYLSYSFDDSTYINDINKAGTAQPYPKQIFIGVGQSSTTVLNYFTGTVNLNHATLQIGDEFVWSGMDDAGLSTRADVSLSNIDEAGEAKIKSVAGSVDVQINGTSIVEDGVANIPVASDSSFGVVKAGTGMYVTSNQTLSIEGASESRIKAGVGASFPITTVRQDRATFYGLAKIAGHDENNSTLPAGTYSDGAKTAIQRMIGINDWELIADVTIEEDADTLTIDKDIDGNPFKYKKIAITYEMGSTHAQQSVRLNDTQFLFSQFFYQTSIMNRGIIIVEPILDTYRITIDKSDVPPKSYLSSSTTYSAVCDLSDIEKIRLNCRAGNNYLIGSKLKVWGKN